MKAVTLAATGLRMDGEQLVRDASPAGLRQGVAASLAPVSRNRRHNTESE
jgi:hypothetical protein